MLQHPKNSTDLQQDALRAFYETVTQYFIKYPDVYRIDIPCHHYTLPTQGRYDDTPVTVSSTSIGDNNTPGRPIPVYRAGSSFSGFRASVQCSASACSDAYKNADSHFALSVRWGIWTKEGSYEDTVGILDGAPGLTVDAIKSSMREFDMIQTANSYHLYLRDRFGPDEELDEWIDSDLVDQGWLRMALSGRGGYIRVSGGCKGPLKEVS